MLNKFRVLGLSIVAAIACAFVAAPALAVVQQFGVVVLTPAGLTTTPTCLANFRREDARITVTCEAGITGTSNATTFTLGTLPASIRPNTARCMNTSVTDNGAKVPAEVCISTAGVLTFGMGAALAPTGFTASAVKAIAPGWSVTYPLF